MMEEEDFVSLIILLLRGELMDLFDSLINCSGSQLNFSYLEIDEVEGFIISNHA